MGGGRSREVTIFVPSPGSGRACADGAATAATANPRRNNLVVDRASCVASQLPLSCFLPCLDRTARGRFCRSQRRRQKCQTLDTVIEWQLFSGVPQEECDGAPAGDGERNRQESCGMDSLEPVGLQ